MGFKEELEELKMLQNMLKEVGGESESAEFTSLIDDLEKMEVGTNNTFHMETFFTNDSNNEDPSYSKEGDSGFDLRAYIDSPVTLKPLQRTLIPTGLKFQLPPHTELQVRPRSGMALKHGITVLNTPGTVDEGYRGDVGIIAVNLSNEEYTIQPGERIAQGVIMTVIGSNSSKLIKKEELSSTERGNDGFGSTGK
jgi:dUTP pyrophosphatase